MRLLLVLLALVSLGAALAQEEGEPAELVSPGVIATLGSHLLGGGTVYCKFSYDGAMPLEWRGRSLCYAEYNLLQWGPARFNVATRFDFLPSLRTTPLVMLDFGQESWFAGVETGFSFGQPGGFYVGGYFGATLPGIRW